MRDAFFLWHLEYLGILNRVDDGFEAPLWSAAAQAEPVTVALIDTGIDVGHPNLAAALAGPQIDFGPAPGGVIHDPGGRSVAALRAALDDRAPRVETIDAALDGLLGDTRAQAARMGLDPDDLSKAVDNALAARPDKKVDAAREVLSRLRSRSAFPGRTPVDPDAATLKALGELKLDETDTATITDLARALAAGPVELPLEDPSRHFGAHGTATAGLICGRPAAESGFGALPYRGANPHARLLSYATPFGPEIRPILSALLAAYLSGAEVIAMPRGALDIEGRAALAASPARRTRIEHDDGTRLREDDRSALARLKEDAALLERLLRAIALRRYLLLAAGNEGWPDRVAYPAAAVIGTPEALIVGAETGDGRPAPYSNGHKLGSRLLTFVSDDAEVADADDLRIDGQGARDWDFGLGTEAAQVHPFAPLTTDLRGNWGYSASARADAPGYVRGELRPALYTPFGGTSAATALAAGTVALLVQAGKLPREGGQSTGQIRRAMEEANLRTPQPDA